MLAQPLIARREALTHKPVFQLALDFLPVGVPPAGATLNMIEF
jgi:hypothetical protein